MDEIINLYLQYVTHIQKLTEFIVVSSQEEADNTYYRENQEIIYTGIINRLYSLWETLTKDVIYGYFTQVKEELISDGSLIQQLKLNELPGYIVDTGIICDQYISYELKKEYVTYTSKNIGINELKNLFGRFGVKIEVLKSNKKILKFIEDNNSAFDIAEPNGDSLKTAMTRLINERNLVSHSSAVSHYENLDTLRVWTEFFKLIAGELVSLTCSQIIEHTKQPPNIIGELKKYLPNKSVLCIDIADGVKIDKASMIIVKRDKKIIYFLKPDSFQVNDIEKEYVQSNDKAGIVVTDIFQNKVNIKDTDIIMVIQAVF